MKKTVGILSVITLFLSEVTFGSIPVSLDDCYKAAIQRSETLSEHEQLFLQSKERESQALGSLLPNVAASATYLTQQAPTDPLLQSFFPSIQPTVKLTASQTLFRGLREFAVMRQLKHLTSAQEQEKQIALIQLHMDVSRNFYTVISLEQDLTDLKTQLDLYEERIGDLKKRSRSGQSSASETLTAQAAKAIAVAQMKQIEGQFRANREFFSFLTGLKSDTTLKAPALSLQKKTSLSDYLESLEKRPDIIAGRQRLDATEDSVAIARGNHLPSADLLGNYYLIRPVGVFQEIKWDVQASLSFPLYSGGVVQSKVREAVSQKAQAELALSKARRSAEQEIRSLYENYQSGLEQVQALEESMKLSEENYLLLKKEYSKGLTRNIDVLQALSQFQEGRRALSRARWNTQADLTRLQLISSLRPLSILRD